VARILLVHGAFNELWGPFELKARWLPAVRDGLWHHGIEIEDRDVDVCFYGDLFRRTPGTDAARRLEQSRAGIAEALKDLAGGDAIAALGQAASDAAFDRTVDMVTIMATTPDLRDRMRARAEPLVSPETRVVVAHSLGTMLSYQALCNHPNWPVHTFVTLGSPLASPMIFDHLDPPPVDGVGQWPGSVQRWVNVRAVGDKAAASSLTERFGPRVEEVLVDNGHRAHDPEPYLNSAATGAAIAAGLAAASS
jgi:pimeloyl-ACP methyl ester carboxylesterase